MLLLVITTSSLVVTLIAALDTLLLRLPVVVNPSIVTLPLLAVVAMLTLLAVELDTSTSEPINAQDESTKLVIVKSATTSSLSVLI